MTLWHQKIGTFETYPVNLPVMVDFMTWRILWALLDALPTFILNNSITLNISIYRTSPQYQQYILDQYKSYKQLSVPHLNAF